MIVIPFTKPALKLSSNVAVVGSSGRLLNTEYGELIDQYDEVIRFNRAPVEGWESKVGSKTTVRVLNAPTYRSAPLKRWTDDQFFVKKLKNQKLLVHALAGKDLRDPDKFCDPSNQVFTFQAGKLGLAFRKNQGIVCPRPTVGFLTLMGLVEAGIKPHLFGFDFEPNLDRTHYWHERPPNAVCHDLNVEMRILQKLKDKKVVIFP